MPNPSSQQGLLIATDMGGTNLRMVLADLHGNILKRSRLPIPAEGGGEGLMAGLGNGILRLLDEAPGQQLLGIAVAIAGPVDRQRGEVVDPPNLAVSGRLPIRQALQERFRVPLLLENDVNAAAVGEHQKGTGRRARDMVYIAIGTGIGGGLILGDRLYVGASGGAGEVGHMTISVGGPPCACGKAGCLEALASGSALEQEAVSQLRAGARSLLTQTTSGVPEAVTVPLIHRAAQEGDDLCQGILARAAEALGTGLANLVNIFNPELIILGGSLANMADLFLEPAIRVAKERAMPLAANALRIEVSQLGDDAGLVGALLLLQEELGLHP